jgi:hypothetical protein
LRPPPSDARWSIAVVRDDCDGDGGSTRRRVATLGEATVVAIEDVRVVLDVGPAVSRCSTSCTRRRACALTGRRVRRSQDGVRRTGLHRYEIQRAVVERLLQGGIAPPWPRVVPQTRDGAPAGFRPVRRGATTARSTRIGLANGDTLIEVNGRAITTPRQRAGGVRDVAAADHISLLIERDGRRIRMDYAIR